MREPVERREVQYAKSGDLSIAVSGAHRRARRATAASHGGWAPDCPWGRTEEEYQREVDLALQIFGPREQARDAARGLGRIEPDELDAFIDFTRFGSSPGARSSAPDEQGDRHPARSPARVPTLILHGNARASAAAAGSSPLTCDARG